HVVAQAEVDGAVDLARVVDHLDRAHVRAVPFRIDPEGVIALDQSGVGVGDRVRRELRDRDRDARVVRRTRLGDDRAGVHERESPGWGWSARASPPGPGSGRVWGRVRLWSMPRPWARGGGWFVRVPAF